MRELVKRLEDEGLKTEDYLKTCSVYPVLLALTPQNAEAKIRAYMYVDKNKIGYKDKDILKTVLERKILTYSPSLIYLKGIILPQLKLQSSYFASCNTGAGLKNKFKYYFEHNPDKKFYIKIIEDNWADSFIATMKEYCKKDLGRDDMFEYVKIPSVGV